MNSQSYPRMLKARLKQFVVGELYIIVALTCAFGPVQLYKNYMHPNAVSTSPKAIDRTDKNSIYYLPSYETKPPQKSRHAAPKEEPEDFQGPDPVYS